MANNKFNETETNLTGIMHLDWVAPGMMMQIPVKFLI